ncbi:hypothetical protein TNCV_26441 [Trichonephila clavipes]|uniref:Uncharacterized protein n=1 Tax=Trichonephila clavipes TaxID=2585209 RepID=A0A8X6WMJ1_TRICX|nr:hypothetical protein TNCV_26441 [Trichonephila clavipes]
MTAREPNILRYSFGTRKHHFSKGRLRNSGGKIDPLSIVYFTAVEHETSTQLKLFYLWFVYLFNLTPQVIREGPDLISHDEFSRLYRNSITWPAGLPDLCPNECI